MRYFAVSHQRDMQGPNDPNAIQYDVLEEKFTQDPPQLVLYEGFIDDVNYPLTKEQAKQIGENAFMAYLVKRHNDQLPEGVDPVHIESADDGFNTLPNEERDPLIVKRLAEKLRKFDRVDIVMGSGHAIREKAALMQLFGKDEITTTDIQLAQVRKELSTL